MAIVLLFFASGFASLVLETVFRRDLGLLTGNAVTATSLTLAAFLGGLAFGARIFGAAADRTSRPLRLYGILELSAAGSAALTVGLLTFARGALLVRSPFVEALVAIVLVACPAAFMGGTLPPLVRHLTVRERKLLPTLSILYGVNTLGAALGAAAAGFVLFETLGIVRTAGFAIALAVACGVSALALDRGSVPSPPRPEAPDAPGSGAKTAVICATLGGTAALGYEVLWTRLLAVPLRSYSYSFSLMLALFLAGIVLGSLALVAVSRRIRDPLAALGVVQIAGGLAVAASVFVLPSLLAVDPDARGFGALLAAGFLRGAPIVLPATILSGMALPLAVQAFGGPAARRGRAVGAVYAANTAGALAGSLAAAFVLLPLLGASRALAILATLSAVSGAFALRRAVPGALAIAACAAVVFVPVGPVTRAFSTAGRGPSGDLLFYREGTTDTVAVIRRAYGFHDEDAKSEIVNGIAMTATVKPVWRYMAAEGHLPALFAPAGSPALVICVGTGITLGALASHATVPSIDALDLSESVIAALPTFSRENAEVVRDPRVRLVHDDGRHALALSRVAYGLITVEPPPPIVAGSVHLYTRDFYRECRAHLAPGGVVAQWLPLHAQSLDSARALARTFLDAFPHVQLWLPSIRDAVLLGSDRPLRLDAARLDAAYANPRTRASLEAAYFETPAALLGTFLQGRDGVAAWSAGADLITDDRPWMEFFHRYGPNMGDREIATLLAPPTGGLEWLDGAGASLLSATAAERRAHLLYVQSEIAGDPAAQRTAAALSTATRFGRYRLGCDEPQLLSLARSTSEGDAWRRQTELCRRLFP
ncbi:MAG TPA: hypothetical protein VFV19_14795 [Candidatus Polarisedimenticolaceae bacterium]|nr:hypothetical protein [Candidatus Polarisedimenticolaceae bacterium]